MTMSERILFQFLCYVILFVNISNCFIVENILRENQNETGGVNLVDLYIPTVNSENERCRNHSLYYLEQLRNYTLWASEMFDASTKFPTGVLYGSAYDFGNFDECLEVRVPYRNEQFSGQYCLAKFVVESPFESDTTSGPYNYHFEDYRKFHNISVWKKVEDFLHDATKSPRNELYFSYCLPSSCSNEDLQLALEKFFQKVSSVNDYTVHVEVSKKTCQGPKRPPLDKGDMIFITVVLIFVVSMIGASIYDLLSRRDDFQHLKIEGKMHHAINCFSFPRNFTKLTTTKVNQDGLDCLAGMKVITMLLVISSHRNMFDFGSAIENPKFVEKFYSNFAMTYTLNAPMQVDTFFTIAGFLATYIILNQYYRSKNGVNLVLLYVHRYIRMTSTYCIILAFYCTLLFKTGTGPLWQERVGSERERCRHSWWANLLYINNYVDTENYCMFQSWFMACDMHAFLFVPIMCWIVWKRAKVGLIVIIAAIITSVIIVFTVVFVNNELPILLIYIRILLSPHTDRTFLNVYIPSHMRLTAYFIGVLTGYIKYNMKANDVKIPRRWVRIGWTLCGVLMFAALHLGFLFYVSKQPAWAAGVYSSLHHVMFSAGIAWIIIATSFGYGPMVNAILAWKPFVVLGRLTYSVYLCHGLVQMYSSGIMRQPVHASQFGAIHKTAADTVLSYSLAFILTMIFESPIIGMEKVLLWPEKKKPDNDTKEEITMSSAELPSTYVAA